MHGKRFKQHAVRIAGGLGFVAGLVVVYLLLTRPAPETAITQVAPASKTAFGEAPSIAVQPAHAAASARSVPSSDASVAGLASTRRHAEAYRALLADHATFAHARRIGFGAFVDEALASAKPELMAEAAALISRCKVQDSLVEGWRDQLHRSQGSSQSFSSGALEAEEDVQRRCQALSEAQKAQYFFLLEGAAKGGVPGTASQFHAALQQDLKDPSTYPWLRDRLVEEAERGNGEAAEALACGRLASSLSEPQRAAYFAALEALAARSDGSGIPYRLMVKYCGWQPANGLAPDAGLLARLLAAAKEPSGGVSRP